MQAHTHRLLCTCRGRAALQQHLRLSHSSHHSLPFFRACPFPSSPPPTAFAGKPSFVTGNSSSSSNKGSTPIQHHLHLRIQPALPISQLPSPLPPLQATPCLLLCTCKGHAAVRQHLHQPHSSHLSPPICLSFPFPSPPFALLALQATQSLSPATAAAAARKAAHQRISLALCPYASV